MAKFSTKSLVNKYSKWGSSSYSNGYKSSSKSYGNSSFWMDDDFLDSEYKSAKSVDIVKLAGYKRAISNFVRIVTGKDNIQVQYSSGNQSYTDGNSVVISSKLDEKEFDSTVGLALHEGSHIALTNFKALDRYFSSNEFYELAAKSGSNSWQVKTRIKTLVNIIEDRRIDRFVYDSAPGYQGYYQSLYDKYFNAKEIDNAIKSGKFNNEAWEDYEFHICNFANPNRKLDTLKALRSIWNTISLPTINRLKSTDDVLTVAINVYEQIMNQIGWTEDKQEGKGQGEGPADVNEDENDNGQGTGSVSGMDDDTNDEMGGMDPNLDQMPGSQSESSDGKAKEQEGEGNGEGGSDSGAEEEEEDKPAKDPKKEAKERQEERKLRDAIQKQKDFLNGSIKKKKLSKKEAEQVNAASESNMEYTPVGGDIPNDTQTVLKGGTTNCMVIRGINKAMIDANLVGGHFNDPQWLKDRVAKYGYQDYVQEGITLGTMLGKRLKTRDEDRTLKTTRMETGRIDRRLIAELGFGNDRVFNQIIHNTVTPSLIHISIDASGSMSGSKWASAMKTSVAIAKAASMINSLDCIISIRGSFGNYYSQQSPLMWVIYDSRKDKFQAAINTFYGVQAAGSTPEGLCYQAVMKDIVGSANGKESFFINICDGEPGYSDSNLSYGGDYAINHTRVQVEKMRKAGIKVLGYFVCENMNSSWMGRSMDNFRKMYGADSEFIDTNSLTQLSLSLNKLFVRK